MTAIVCIDGHDVSVYPDAQAARDDLEAWVFMDVMGPPPALFTREGGRVEAVLSDPTDEQGDFRLVPSEPTPGSIEELTGMLRDALRTAERETSGMSLDALIELIPG
jgi:hypothetical protein